jgi:p-aminobenzoyl-glutamate transporter AbgT
MEQPQYLIDSNAVIDYLGNKLPTLGMVFMNSIIDSVPIISVVSKIEILSYNAPDEHYKTLSNFINDATVLDLTNNVVETCIQIRKKTQK